jgi:hypothetical protein
VLDGDELVLLLPSLDKSHVEGYFQFLRDHLDCLFTRHHAANCSAGILLQALHRAPQRVLVSLCESITWSTFFVCDFAPYSATPSPRCTATLLAWPFPAHRENSLQHHNDKVIGV